MQYKNIWLRVNKSGPIPETRPDLGPCWLWTGASISDTGYGRLMRRGKYIKAHRYVYALVRGPIPDGMELDHLCRVHLCVNPDHLEPVSHKVNCTRGVSIFGVNAQKSECLRGHPFDEANTWIRKNGNRQCRACGKLRAARARMVA